MTGVRLFFFIFFITFSLFATYVFLYQLVDSYGSLKGIKYTNIESEIPISSLPDPIFNPGETRDWHSVMICETTWSKIPRRIYDSHKRVVSNHYGIDFDTEKSLYEYDHLIPRCLGGADTVKNLFPLPRTGAWNAYDKNRLERQACIMVCKGKLELERTQNLFAKNWIRLYREIFMLE
jgi:hypothetical protein